MKAGVQLSVPLFWSAAAVNVAPAGSPVAASDVMGSLSGSGTVTSTVSGVLSATLAVAGAVTTGARSALVTVMVVLAEPDKALLAVNVTV